MVAPVDMRRGIDGLSALVEQALQLSPCAGSAFVFCNRAGMHQGAVVGWYRRVVVPAPLASGAVCLGTFGYGRDGTDFVAMGVVDCRGGLASFRVAVVRTKI